MFTSRCVLRKYPLNRLYSQKSTPNQPTKSITVPGLTSYVIKQKAEPLGPGASKSKEYKVPEYFCYDRYSYTSAEVEMAKYRCPQPSAVKKN